ncbi:MAG TPA: universal stress protein, partial [Gemmatimonadaceae bacterium]
MFTKILVPLDGSTLAEQAIGSAAAIARASHGSLELVLVHDPLTFAGFENAPWDADASTVEREYLENVA